MADFSGYSDFIFGNPTWLGIVGLVACLFVLLSLASYWKSKLPWWTLMLGVSLRSAGVGLLLFCLLEPMATLERPKPQANSFAIVVDRSQSLDVMNRQREKLGLPTWNGVLDESSEWQRRLSDNFRVRRYWFDATLEPTDSFQGVLFQGHHSSLYGSLRSLKDRYQNKPLAGVLLLTDGQSTDLVPDDLASEIGFPVYPIRLGDIRKQQDVRIESVTMTQSEFETAPCTVQAKITHVGCAGESIRVDLVDSTDNRVQSQSHQLKQDDTPVAIDFRFRPEKPGVQGFRVVVRRESELASPNAGSAATVPPNSQVEAVVPKATDAVTNELTLGNNRRYLVVDRGRGPYRILYLAGRPNWEFKFLKRALEEDAEVRLTALIRIARKEIKFNFRDSGLDQSNPLFSGFEDVIAEEKEQFDESVFARLGLASSGELKKGFPKSADELFEYSAILVDDLEHDFFTAEQQSMLRQFVSVRGGGLMVLGGEESFNGRGFRDSALGQMLPVYGDDSPSRPDPTTDLDFDLDASTPVRFTLTREGWLQPFLRTEDSELKEKERLALMPGFEVLNTAGGVKPGASVLVEGVLADGADATESKKPVFVTQRFGKGRTAAFLIGDMWRWGLRNAKNTPSPVYQSWRQMVRWLIADVPKKIQMKIDDLNPSNRSARVLVEVKGPDFRSIDNASVSIAIVSPSGKETVVQAEPSAKVSGQYAMALVADEEGVYAMTADVTAADGSTLGTSQLGWIHDPAAREFQELGENTAALERIAQQTGGEMIEVNELESFVQSLESRKVPVTEIKTVPLWHQGWVILLALGCICGEWGLRRRYGLA